MSEVIRVLIVEDDSMVAEINKRYTEKTGGFWVVGVATTGEEAVEAVRSLNPDLVLLDVYLPRGNGLEVLRSIRAADIAADVILITAAQDAVSVEQALRYGAVDYIIKPFDFHRLAGTLNAYRERRRRLAERERLGQAEIDRLVKGVPAGVADPVLPKGLDRYTLDQVQNYLCTRGGALSAQEVAAALGLSRVTVRRYLEYLVEAGEATAELEYVPVGRPVKRYRST
ncbi:MAG: two-component system, CitB family, response regulator [Bacillota bacterium]|jgi:two-component system response regulator DctR|nr:two-component system, CitB family, response regulator [Bacillota bacterium]MDK2854906.1 two-component system, CitB family, response regulator [Bacillota bacterium]MDK2925915.1 two-component system, CitB family, response regulator [Bacillota bacterium]